MMEKKKYDLIASPRSPAEQAQLRTAPQRPECTRIVSYAPKNLLKAEKVAHEEIEADQIAAAVKPAHWHPQR